MPQCPKPMVLMILDGYGYNPRQEGNAVLAAPTPNLDRYLTQYPSTFLSASGEFVGLPAGQMGNSEVGHQNLGAGRIVYQELTRISKAVREGQLLSNPVLLEAMQTAKAEGRQIHFMGLLSDGGVHSHQEHLHGLLAMAKQVGIAPEKVLVHALLDGRDTPPQSGLGYVKDLEQRLAKDKLGRIATVAGRYYTMDRDQRWERVVKGWQAMVDGKGELAASASEAVQKSYAAGVNDEFVVPVVVGSSRLEDGDAFIFFNFRGDRARQISRVFVDPAFNGFVRERVPKVRFVCLTQYDETLPAPVAFQPQVLKNILGEVLSAKGLKQLRLAETEKYAHVTFFFNGGEEKVFPGEDRALVPSPKVATYDLKPEMSAAEVADEAVRRIESGAYDVIIMNFANSDMVGHTGVYGAALEALKTVDACVGKVTEAALKKGGVVMITADHGNSEQMLDYAGKCPFTAHTTNPVPLALVGMGQTLNLRGDGMLADVAPTLLEIMGIEKPAEMSGSSLIAARS
jgi:2,3-bisphosphoglycerate-independent phosphoglycerate mutase